MSPRTADASVRTALIEAAARLIADKGTEYLTLRRLADEVGTSTMSVYTHFGGMEELRREVRREGFARLATHLAGVEQGSDPIADLTLLGLAYYRNGNANPNLYRVMFMERPLDETDASAGIDTFTVLVSGVARCIAAERLDRTDPAELATQLWAVVHGFVTLELAGLLPPAQALHSLFATAQSLSRAYGDDPHAAARSVAAARRRAGLHET
ncbi:MAG: TetR/AcrR family transcriptional regulator [Chloroflexota bacterium]|nr:TetR/AcrR family transcriptional regulator [Chloroflexota bacterium]